jgi:phosphoglycerate dehydrogenase-like enzyme
MKALCFAQENGAMSPAFLKALRDIPGLEVETIDDWASLDRTALVRLMQGSDILVASRSPAVPDELSEDPGNLKYICYLHGTMRRIIGLPIIRSAIKVTNWGDHPGPGLAQASLTLLLALFKDLPKRILAVRNGDGKGIRSVGERISDMNIGVYGFGFGGREFVRLLRPFEATVTIYDPYVDDVPDDCIRVDALNDLFSVCHAIVIHAGLTEETRNSVTRELLAMLPDQGIVINTARGAIIDQAALFDELRSGRLRAGLDVLWPDDLPEDHEARQWENLIWTCHQFRGEPWPDERAGKPGQRGNVHLDNIRAFVEGRPLQFEIDEVRYSRMT